MLTWSRESKDDYGLAEAVDMTFTRLVSITVYTVQTE